MHFFTDFFEGDEMARDEDGLDFADLAEAGMAAAEALTEIARDALRVGRRPCAGRDAPALHLAAQVRDAAGRVVFRARLDVDFDWTPAPP